MKTRPLLVGFWLVTGWRQSRPRNRRFHLRVQRHWDHDHALYRPGGAVTIPDTVHGLPVTSLGYEAFSAAPV